MVEVLLGYLVLFAEWQCGLPQTTRPAYLHAETLNPAQARTGRDGTGLGLSSTLLERLQFRDRERAEEDGENPDRVQSQKGRGLW